MSKNTIIITNTETKVVSQGIQGPKGEQGIQGDVGTVGAHSDLTGLDVDDHTQYHNDTRGDTRYYTKTILNAGQLDTRYYTETEIDTSLALKATIVYADAQDAITLSSSNTYSDGLIIAHEGSTDPHTQYILVDGTRAFTAGQTVADTPDAINSGDYPVQSISGVTDGAAAVGHIRDTSEILDTPGAIVDTLKTGGTDIYNVIWEAGGGLFSNEGIIIDFNRVGVTARIVKFVAGGTLGSFTFLNSTKTAGIGIFPGASGFASPSAGTTLDSAAVNFGWNNGGSYWAGFYKDDTTQSFKPSGGTGTSLGDTTAGDSATTRWNGLYIRDNSGAYFGNNSDALIDYDGFNLNINPKLVGTGIVDFLGDIRAEDMTITASLVHQGTAAGFFNTTPVTKPTALTAADASTVDVTYGTEESNVINNLRTRLNELESKLQELGLLS